jgi:hypothetical protein
MKLLVSLVGTLVFVCFVHAAVAQITAFTSDGRKVILNMDGTWKFVFDNDGKKVILNPDGTWKYEGVKDSAGRVVIKPVRDSLKMLSPDSTRIAPVKPPVKKAPLNLDCTALVGIERDITSDSWFGESRKIIVSDDSKLGFSISFLNTKKGPVTWITTLLEGGHCIDETNKMIVVFKDGNRLQLVNDGKSNCTGTFTLYFTGVYGKETSLEAFKKMEISSMRVYYTKGYVDGSFTEENALRFKAALNCLVK